MHALNLDPGAGVRKVLGQYVPADNQSYHRELEYRGYGPVRTGQTPERDPSPNVGGTHRVA